MAVPSDVFEAKSEKVQNHCKKLGFTMKRDAQGSCDEPQIQDIFSPTHDERRDRKTDNTIAMIDTWCKAHNLIQKRLVRFIKALCTEIIKVHDHSKFKQVLNDAEQILTKTAKFQQYLPRAAFFDNLDFLLHRFYYGNAIVQSFLYSLADPKMEDVFGTTEAFCASVKDVNPHWSLKQAVMFHQEQTGTLSVALPSGDSDETAFLEIMHLTTCVEKLNHSNWAKYSQLQDEIRGHTFHQNRIASRSEISRHYKAVLTLVRSFAEMPGDFEGDDAKIKNWDKSHPKSNSKKSPNSSSATANTALAKGTKQDIDKLVTLFKRNCKFKFDDMVAAANAKREKRPDGKYKGASNEVKEAQLAILGKSDALKGLVTNALKGNKRFRVAEGLKITPNQLKNATREEFQALLLLNPSTLHQNSQNANINAALTGTTSDDGGTDTSSLTSSTDIEKRITDSVIKTFSTLMSQKTAEADSTDTATTPAAAPGKTQAEETTDATSRAEEQKELLTKLTAMQEQLNEMQGRF